MGGFNSAMEAKPAPQANNDLFTGSGDSKSVREEGFVQPAPQVVLPTSSGMSAAQTPSAAVSQGLLESAGSFAAGGQAWLGETGGGKARSGDGWPGALDNKIAQPTAPRQDERQVPQSGLLTSLAEESRQNKPRDPLFPIHAEAAKGTGMEAGFPGGSARKGQGGILEMMAGYPQWREGYLRNYDRRQQEILNIAAPKPNPALAYASNEQRPNAVATGNDGQASNPNKARNIGDDGDYLERIRQENAEQRKLLEEKSNNWWSNYGKQAENDPSRPTSPVAPKAAFDPVVGDKTTPPAYKKGYLSKQPGAWEGFNKATDKLPNAGENQKFAYGQIFAAEGGVAKDPESSASSGILQTTLEDARKRVPGLENAKTPSDLTLDQRAAVMKDYFDQSLRTVGGAKALDDLPTPQAAAAFGDTIYRHGSGDGAKAIQEAIRRVDPGRVETDGKMGPETFKAFWQLADNPKTSGKLLDYLTQERLTLTKGVESERMAHFRFSSRR